MHRQDAADISLQDRHSSIYSPALARRPVLRVLARVARAWMDGWTWYTRNAWAPAAMAPTRVFRAHRAAALARPRWTSPCPPPRFALLFGRAAGAECP